MYKKVSDSLVKLADNLVTGGKLTELVKELKENPDDIKKMVEKLSNDNEKEAGIVSKAFLTFFLAMVPLIAQEAREPLKLKMVKMQNADEVTEKSLNDIMRSIIEAGLNSLKKTKKEADAIKLEREIEKQTIGGYIQKADAEGYLDQIKNIMGK